jgi:long-chain fatty acid transport protein
LVLAVGLLAATSGPVLASGFSIYEQSAKASAQAGAWVARADDAAANWYNPASLVRLEGMEVQFGFNMITIGSDTTFTIDDPFWEGLSLALGAPVANGTEFDAVQNDSFPPHLYFSHKINDRLAWGVGVNTPFGLVSEWSDRPVTVSHQRAELVTIVVNPNIAYAINDAWSVAFGLSYMHADVKEFSREVPAADVDSDGVYDVIGVADLSGTGDAWGWDVALLYARDAWSFGFTYRAELEPDIDGDLRYGGFEALGPLAPEDTVGSTTLNLPAQAAIGVAWKATDAWTFEFDITWAGWSNFEALDITVEDGDDIYLFEDWDDTQAFRLGAAWALNEKHELRFGALIDESPVPVYTLRPSIPDSDRKSVTVGYGYSGQKWYIDAYYMPLWFDEITSAGDPANKPGVTLTPDGVIDGEYSSFVHLLGATFGFRF